MSELVSALQAQGIDVVAAAEKAGLSLEHVQAAADARMPLLRCVDVFRRLADAADMRVDEMLALATGLDLKPCPDLRPGESACRAGWHETPAGVRRCKEAVRQRTRDRISREEETLRGTIARVTATGRLGWEGWSDTTPLAERQRRATLEAVAANVSGNRLSLGLMARTGIGKTWCLLELHFALLEVGIDSVWLEASRLHIQHRDRASQLEERRQPAEDRAARCKRAAVVVIPDIGDPAAMGAIAAEATEAAAQAAELVDIIDGSGAAIAWATNHVRKRTMPRDPSIGPRLTSRLLQNSLIVQEEPEDGARDFRVASSRRAE